MTVELQVRDVEARLSGRTVIAGVTVLVGPGELAVAVGPNGSGKSSLLRTVYRSLRPSAGAVHVSDDDVWRLNARQASQRVATLTQERPAAAELTVREVVALGRLPWQRAFATLGSSDCEAVDDAIARTGIGDLAHRRFTRLSGGERQRVLVARAFAQRSPLIVLDEPTNHLDVRHQLGVLDLARATGATVLAAMHDLNLAASFADRVHVLDRGTLRASGPPEEVLTPALVAEVFGVHATPVIHPVTGRPQFFLSTLGG